MAKKATISAVINTRNEANSLKKCLDSIKDFADEIIVVDMHSTDQSVSVAKSFGARVFSYRPQKVVEHARNFALAKATGKWILLLDPDEYLKKNLKKELQKIVNRNQVDFVKIPRKNIIFGKWLRHTNMWPDYLIRFFKKNAVTWQTKIHSQPITSGTGLTLLDSPQLAINHQNYKTITDYLNRSLRYTDVQSDELKKQKYVLKISDLLIKPIEEFNSRFFSSQGYKDGLHGLVFSLLQAFSVCLVYIRLWEKQPKKNKPLPKDSFVSASLQADFEYGFWFTKFFQQDFNANPFKILILKFQQFLGRISRNF